MQSDDAPRNCEQRPAPRCVYEELREFLSDLVATASDLFPAPSSGAVLVPGCTSILLAKLATLRAFIQTAVRQTFPIVSQLVERIARSAGRGEGGSAAVAELERAALGIVAATRVVELGVSSAAEWLVPVVVITGYLGSGKTTLLNHILRGTPELRCAVIENEFGEVGVDDTLVKETIRVLRSESMYLVSSGCVCCTIRDDLVRVCKTLLADSAGIDLIVVETTGLANPGPVIQSFFYDEELSLSMRLEGVITVVDAKNMGADVAGSRDSAFVQQIAYADRVVLNKTDLVSPDELWAVEQSIRGINPSVQVIPALYADVSLDLVLNISRTIDCDTVLGLDPVVENLWSWLPRHGTGARRANNENECGHDHEVSSVTCTAGELSSALFLTWIGEFLEAHGESVMRIKGVVAMDGDGCKWVVQSVHKAFTCEPLAQWKPCEVPQSKLVFIGRHLDAESIRTQVAGCLMASP
eukprot:m51a1_g12440 hypothetical protein (469) ;mRNA; r:841296-842958